MADVYEQFFLLKYHGGWSLIEAYNLPVALRTWFIKRLSEQIESENEQIREAQRQSSSKIKTSYGPQRG